MSKFNDIRNVAIIAHVDHGKTTLVDGMLKQTHTFRENQAEMNQTTILDTNELEREKGITILAKNTAVFYKGVKINIIDTPGHADFGGEVERVLNMADGALLVVDAGEGPLPQTKFVLQKAFEAGLEIIVVINKIDRNDARVSEVLSQTEDLFLKLATSDKQLNFPVVYTIGKQGKAGLSADRIGNDLSDLFDSILKYIPNAVGDMQKPVQMLVSTLDYDNHLGKLAIGRLKQGTLQVGQKVIVLTPKTTVGSFNIEKMYLSRGIIREQTERAVNGDIVAIAGFGKIEIGQTICDPSNPVALPEIKVSEPTLKVRIGPNTSPLAGREGKFVTSRQLEERLDREIETNLGMNVVKLGGGEFEVAGRGELHLAILIETMRREGYEMQVSKPQVILSGNKEPFDEVTIEVAQEYVGEVTSEMGKRRAEMLDLKTRNDQDTVLVYKISQRNLLGTRNVLLTKTKGTVVIHTNFIGYFEQTPPTESLRNGVLVATQAGKALAYSLEAAQERGLTFVDPNEEVYEGMIVGLANKDKDIDMNITKGKHLTNTRASNKDIKTVLTPAYKMSLEQALDFLEEDELVEITPKNLRLRKKHLAKLDRIRAERSEKKHAPN